MVRMAVCIPHRIDVADIGGKQLEPELGWRIDQNRAPVQLQQRPVPCPLVSGVLRRADVAITPDDRHTERGSCPEECESHESHAARHGGGSWKLPLGDLKSKALARTVEGC